MKNSSKILIALGTGMAVGGLLGLLFAPDKGSETRKKIVDAEKKISEKVKEKVAMGKEKISDLRGDRREKAEIVNDKVKDFA